MKFNESPKINTEVLPQKVDDEIVMWKQKEELLKLLSEERLESKKEEIRKKLKILRKKIDQEAEKRAKIFKEKQEKNFTYISYPISPYIETDEEKNKRIEREKKYKEYEDNYAPSWSGLGFNEGEIKEPEKWQPQDHQKEQQLVNKVKFEIREMIEGAIDENGNIKNGSKLFSELFYNKISLVLGKKFAEDCINYNWYVPWKEGEMQNDLSKFINDNRINKKDVEKIVTIRFIGDMAFGLIDDEGDSHINSFVSNSLITRFKNKDTSILEKYYIKNVIYEIIDIESFSSYSFDNKEKRDKLFLKKEIGEKSSPKKYHDKSFNRFEFQLSDNQVEMIFHNEDNWIDVGIKPINYYRDSNIKVPTSYYVGEYDTECYISSIFAPGIVGVYSVDGVLVGWKNILDLKEEQPNTINDTFEFKKENQIITKEDLALFKVSSSLGFRDYIQKILELNLSTIDIKNQFYFLNYIQGKTEDELNKFKKFIRKSKSDVEKSVKLKTFLSIEHGGKDMGDKILKIGENLPEVAQKVFAKYGEIIDSVDNVEQEIKNIYKNEEIPANIYLSIREVLLKEGVNLLLKVSDNINNKEKIDEEKILKDLEEVKTNTIILGSSYVELYKEGIKVPIEDITKIEEVSTKNISDKEKEKLLHDYRNGRSEVESKNLELMNILEKEFENELSNKENTLFVVRFDEDIIISAVVDKKDKDILYIGGLTFVDEVRNPAIGVSAMESVLKRFSDYKIQALVAAKNPIVRMYLKRFGFKIIRELPREENAGELYYEIERPKIIKEEKIIGDKRDLEKAA